MALDAEGWTILTASGDSRLIYVSTSGSDSNDGLSDTTPKQTIAAGMALLRDGYPDWLQLKCGDTWTDETIGWVTSGRSASEPQVLTSYGTGARPLLRRSGDFGIFSCTGGTRRSNLCIVDIRFLGRYGTPTASSGTAISVVSPIDNLLIEGCKIEDFSLGISCGGPDGTQYDAVIRRNVLCDIYATDSVHAQGMYYSTVDGLTIDENVLINVGHMPSNVNATAATIFRHGCYIQTTCTDPVFRKNIVLNAGSHGVQMRPGGEVSDCVFVKCAIAGLIGADNVANATGQKLLRNVIQQGRDIGVGLERGWTFECIDWDGGEAAYNLAALNPDGGFPNCLLITRAPNSGVEVHHNVWYDWIDAGTNGIILSGSSTELDYVNLHDNQVQEHLSASADLVRHTATGTTANVDGANNTFWREPGGGSPFYNGSSNVSLSTYKTAIGDTTSIESEVTYTDPTRDVGAYNGHLGGTATYDAFETALRAQRKGAWDTDYEATAVADWIRAGFDLEIPETPSMAASDARPVPIKNTAFRAYFPILDADGDLVTGAAGLDSEVSLDGASFADCTNEATEIGSSGIYYLDLTTSEMNADCSVVIVKTSTTGAKTTVLTLYPQESGDIKVDVQSFGGTAGTFASGRPEVNMSHIAGSAVSTSTAQIGVNAVQAGGTAWGSGAITAASIAADAITAAKIADNAIDAGAIAADAITAAKIADGAIDAGSIATGAITAAKFAAGAVDAAALAADAVAEIADGVWDEAISGHLTGGTTGNALNAAGSAGDPWSTPLPGAYSSGTAGKILGDNLNATVSSRASQTSLDTVDDFLDTEVAAIKAKTDNLPASPAATGDIPSAATVADAVWDEALSGHTTAGSAGKSIADTEVDAAAIEVDTQDIQSRIPAALVSGRIDATVGAMQSAVLTAAAIASDAITSAKIATGAVDADAIATDAGNKIADHILRRNLGNVSAGDTEAFRSIIGAIRKLVNRVAVSGSTLTVYKEDDSTSAGTQTVTTSGSASPITALDTN